MNEFKWISHYFSPLAGTGALGLKDDAALLDVPSGEQLIITSDTLNEGIHFKAGTPPGLIAQKALRVNLSDLAAKGAAPLGYSLNLSLPAHTDEAFIAQLCEGLAKDQACFKVMLIGGDTTRTQGPFSVSITAYGATPLPLLRSGARPGDDLYVSGRIGAGYLGLGEHSSEMIAHYERPEPRLSLGQSLRGIATACMDISDGLVQDLGHLCAASGVGARIELTNIPLADPTYDAAEQITGGDDYELLFTAAKGATVPTGVTKIGIVSEDLAIIWRNNAGEAMQIEHGGWQHF